MVVACHIPLPSLVSRLTTLTLKRQNAQKIILKKKKHYLHIHTYTRRENNNNPSFLKLQESTQHQKPVIFQRPYQCCSASLVCSHCIKTTWWCVLKSWMAIEDLLPEIWSDIQGWIKNQCLFGSKKNKKKNLQKPKTFKKFKRLSAIVYMPGHKISTSHMLVKYVSGW